MKANIELFFGTGGVGKTTLATTRAVHLVKKKKKVLLISIDPSRRLKQLFSLKEELFGKIQQINLKDFFPSLKNSFFLDTKILAPKETFIASIPQKESSFIDNNIIIKTLLEPHGGMNEILGLIDIKNEYNKKYYDTIIIDTPPGQHFIDFLYNFNKIESLFKTKFISTFINLSTNTKSISLINKLTNTTIKKLLEYIEKITGESFINEFIQSLQLIYHQKNIFMDALAFHSNILTNPQYSKYFLVTSIEQHKIKEAISLNELKNNFSKEGVNLLINKSLHDLIDKDPNKYSEDIQKIIDNLHAHETNITTLAKQHFSKTKIFPEVFFHEPIQQIEHLIDYWEK